MGTEIVAFDEKVSSQLQKTYGMNRFVRAMYARLWRAQSSRRLADGAEQGFLFRLDATTVNEADFKEEDDQAEPVAKCKADAEEHDKAGRVARMPYPAVRALVDHWLVGADRDRRSKVLAQRSKTVPSKEITGDEQLGSGVQSDTRIGNDEPGQERHSESRRKSNIAFDVDKAKFRRSCVLKGAPVMIPEWRISGWKTQTSAAQKRAASENAKTGTFVVRIGLVLQRKVQVR